MPTRKWKLPLQKLIHLKTSKPTLNPRKLPNSLTLTLILAVKGECCRHDMTLRDHILSDLSPFATMNQLLNTVRERIAKRTGSVADLSAKRRCGGD